MSVDLSKQEKDDVATALKMMACFIETGNPMLSAQDASSAKKPFKALGLDEMEKVVRLRRLAERIEGIRHARPQIE